MRELVLQANEDALAACRLYVFEQTDGYKVVLIKDVVRLPAQAECVPGGP